MKLWHVHRDDCTYDEYDAFVVRAITRGEAIEIARTKQGATYRLIAQPDGRAKYENVPTEWEAEPVDNDGEPGIILGSFNAG